MTGSCKFSKINDFNANNPPPSFCVILSEVVDDRSLYFSAFVLFSPFSNWCKRGDPHPDPQVGPGTSSVSQSVSQTSLTGNAGPHNTVAAELAVK